MGKTIELVAADGHKLNAYQADATGTPRGAIVVVQEIFGVNSHIRGVADGYASDGYTVIAPALFDRTERDAELGYTEEDVARGRALRGKLGWEEVMHDMQAAISAASEFGKVGIVGYCFGGSVAWMTATQLQVSCSVGYYGGQIAEHASASPGCPVMLHFGEQDAAIPLDGVAKVGEAHPDIPIHLYPAGHGFNCEQRGSYHEPSAAIARERTLDFFREHVG